MEHIMKKQNTFAGQRGAAALIISAILLFSATLVVLLTSRSSLMEQKISANEVRAKQALAAAQAGVDHAFAQVAANGLDADNNNVADTVTPLALASGGSYQVKFCSASVYSTTSGTAPTTLPDCPSAPAALTCTAAGAAATRFVIYGCGWSDDNAARQKVVMVADTGPVVASPPTNPMIALGTVNVSGSATVTNYYNNLTIWSGNNLSNIGNSGKTFVRNPSAAQPDDNTAPPSQPTTCSPSASYVCTSDKSKIGPDVISQDLGLQGLTGGEFFQNFFGTDPTTYQANYVTKTIAAADFSTLDNVGGKVIWVNGNASTSGNITIGVPAPDYTVTDTGSSAYYGKPVVLIIDGDFSGGGNLTVNGIVYVGGNLTVAGNITVHGTIIVQGAVSGTGSLDVIYDPRAVKGAALTLGPKAGLAGGWRDWR